MSNIIDLSTRIASRPAVSRPIENVGEVDMAPRKRLPREPQTLTAKNAHLRGRRRDAWWAAERQVGYWKARMGMHSAISSVQRAGLPEGRLHADAEL